VASVVAGWYADRQAPLKQATAARAYGLSLGPTDADAALAALDRLSTIRVDQLPERAAVPLGVAIGEGLADLVAGDAEGLIPRVYGMLRGWVEDRHRGRTGQLAFLILASGLRADAPTSRPGRSGPPPADEPSHAPTDAAAEPASWPALLYLARRHEHLREPLSALWQGVVRHGAYAQEATNVMTGWAGQAEGQAEVRDALLRTVRDAAAGDPRFAHFMRLLADDWTDDDNLNPLPVTANAVRALLNRRPAHDRRPAQEGGRNGQLSSAHRG
jgi:hypothetical protein